MSWVVRACIGPTLWALAFVVVYALHGMGCAWGWPAVATPLGSLHTVVLVGTWALWLVATWVALRWVPRAPGVPGQVIAAGGWIGWGGTLLTLFPVLGVSSCG